MMNIPDFDTVTEATQFLKSNGYPEDFVAKGDGIQAIQKKKTFTPKELSLIQSIRFEGMTNPSDSSELLILEAEDGTCGTLLMAYGAKHSQSTEAIKQIIHN